MTTPIQPAASAPPTSTMAAASAAGDETTRRITAARKWLILASLAVTGADLLFFILAPSLGYPLMYPDNTRIMQIVLPVALGYLGSMTAFLFQNPQRLRVNPQALPFLEFLVKGPVVIFAVATIAAVVAFGYGNRQSAPIGTGMSVDTLSLTISAALGLLMVTTNALVSFLFNASAVADKEADGQAK